MSQNKQKILLEIVKSWQIKNTPEYRRFCCGVCQKSINEAWYHLLDSKDYLLPLHLCPSCDVLFQNNSLSIKDTAKSLVIEIFFNLSPLSENRFKEIVKSWKKSEPQLKVFFCDDCGKDLQLDPVDGFRKGWHVWWKNEEDQRLSELHFHKSCGEKLGIK